MRFNQILVVDSVPIGERNTARNLHADVAMRAKLVEEAPAVVYLRVESSDHFLAVLDQLIAAVEQHQHVPILHIECHGSQEGLQFADGSRSRWLELKPKLMALNTATRLNLLVIVSACEGSAIASTVGVVDRAPLWGFIGPMREVYPEQLEISFLAFYETLFRSRSASEAMAALRKSAPDSTYMLMTAETMFQLIWDHYQAEYENTEAVAERAYRLHVQMADWPPERRRTPEGIAQFSREINPRIFERFRDRFFMLDLYPENASRFDVRYTAPPQAFR